MGVEPKSKSFPGSCGQLALSGATQAIFHRSIEVSCLDQSSFPEFMSNASTASEYLESGSE
jgi:hypothetical protein